MRDPRRIDHILGVIKRLWHQAPDLRLCQLISNAVGRATEQETTDCFYVEDDTLLKGLELSIEDLIRAAITKRAKEAELGDEVRSGPGTTDPPSGLDGDGRAD